jgi:Holliday junction resolvase RusA-like endonuclease
MARRQQRYPWHVQMALDAAVEAQDTRPRAVKIDLSLPFPPSLNNAYPTIVTRAGKVTRVKSSRAKQYFDDVKEQVGLWLNFHGLRPPLPPYRLALRVYPPADGRAHDLTNCFKLPEDALMAAIGGDDNDTVHVEADKLAPDGYPRIVVTLEGEV